MSSCFSVKRSGVDRLEGGGEYINKQKRGSPNFRHPYHPKHIVPD